jgi:hypothetical protein
MTTARECKCCQEYPDLVEKLDGFSCITQHPGFIGNCLNRDVVEVSFFEFLQDNGPIGDEEPVHEYVPNPFFLNICQQTAKSKNTSQSGQIILYLSELVMKRKN